MESPTLILIPSVFRSASLKSLLYASSLNSSSNDQIIPSILSIVECIFASFPLIINSFSLLNLNAKNLTSIQYSKIKLALLLCLFRLLVHNK